MSIEHNNNKEEILLGLHKLYNALLQLPNNLLNPKLMTEEIFITQDGILVYRKHEPRILTYTEIKFDINSGELTVNISKFTNLTGNKVDMLNVFDPAAPYNTTDSNNNQPASSKNKEETSEDSYLEEYSLTIKEISDSNYILLINGNKPIEFKVYDNNIQINNYISFNNEINVINNILNMWNSMRIEFCDTTMSLKYISEVIKLSPIDDTIGDIYDIALENAPMNLQIIKNLINTILHMKELGIDIQDEYSRLYALFKYDYPTYIEYHIHKLFNGNNIIKIIHEATYTKLIPNPNPDENLIEVYSNNDDSLLLSVTPINLNQFQLTIYLGRNQDIGIIFDSSMNILSITGSENPDLFKMLLPQYGDLLNYMKNISNICEYIKQFYEEKPYPDIVKMIYDITLSLHEKINKFNRNTDNN